MKNIPARQVALASLLCLAAFGAQAQSNVKVYGLLDLGLTSSKAAATSTTPVVSQTTVDSGNMTTSFYGISGTEDLGGGLSAQFKLEGFLRADTGEQGRLLATGNTDEQFSRQANVGLSHKDYGTLSMGRNMTALWVSSLTYNAFGNSLGFSPTMRHYFGRNQNSVTGDMSWKDSIAYSSPNFSGFTFGAAWAAKEDPSTVTPGSNWSVNASYGMGPWSVAVVVQDVAKDQLTTAAANRDTHTTQFNGSYDFGVAKVFLQYGKANNDTTNIDRKLTDLSVRVPVGKGAVLAAWGLNTPSITNASTTNRKTTSVGYVYPLSKQTDLYAAGMYDKAGDYESGYSYSAGMRVRF